MTLISYFTLNSGVKYLMRCLLTELDMRGGHGLPNIHCSTVPESVA